MRDVSAARMIVATPTRITPIHSSRLAGAHPALHDRLGLAFTGDQQPACHVQEDAQSSDETQQGKGDPDYPGGHSQVEGQPSRYSGYPAAFLGSVKSWLLGCSCL